MLERGKEKLPLICIIAFVGATSSLVSTLYYFVGVRLCSFLLSKVLLLQHYTPVYSVGFCYYGSQSSPHFRILSLYKCIPFLHLFFVDAMQYDFYSCYYEAMCFIL